MHGRVQMLGVMQGYACVHKRDSWETAFGHLKVCVQCSSLCCDPRYPHEPGLSHDLTTCFDVSMRMGRR